MLLERLVTPQDYFHLPHVAESGISDIHKTYYYDVRKRADYRGEFQGQLPLINVGNKKYVNPVNVSQYGLGLLQNYWDSGDVRFLDKAILVGKELINVGETRNKKMLVWPYPVLMLGKTHWLSAMAQGQAVSFLLRLAILSNNELFYENAIKALEPFFHTIDDNGVMCFLNNHIWFEEYCIDKPPFTLNGFIVALLGVYDASIVLGDNKYSDLYVKGLDSLLQNVYLFDYHGWSKYDLSQTSQVLFNLRNLASPFYQRFHIELLKIMYDLTQESVLSTYCVRWQYALEKGLIFYRALLEKGIYRLINPITKAS